MNEGIIQGLEYHGRLLQKSGGPVAPGVYEVEFSFHSDSKTSRSNWRERQKNIQVGPDGWFSTVLGQQIPIMPHMFKDRARWVSVRAVLGGRTDDEYSPRICVVGSSLQLIRDVERLDGRVAKAEVFLDGLQGAPTTTGLKVRLDDLGDRLDRIEVAELARLTRLVDQMLDRVDRVDAEDGRLERIEDRLGDMDGPDGDVIDLNARLDDIEKRAVRVLEHLEVGPTRAENLEKAVAKLRDDLSRNDQEGPEEASPDRVEPLSRAGGTMTGGLTIERGGLTVQSGEIHGTLVKVYSVDAVQAVRSARVVAEHVEMRGDLTVDNTQRAIQVRRLEGRSGSAKKDGPLWLNRRGGFVVVVGNKESSNGLEVHGAVKATGADLAEHFEGADLEPGEVVRMSGGRRIVRSDTAFDTRVVGVVSEQPGVALGCGAGSVPVALRGTVRCRVVGPVRLGDLLVPSDVPGHAMAASSPECSIGCLLGKAMEDLPAGRGTVLVLVL